MSPSFSKFIFSTCIKLFIRHPVILFGILVLSEQFDGFVQLHPWCIRVCVCVCVYALPPVGFFQLHDICDIREKFGSTIFCSEHFLGASAKFLHLYLRIYLISPPKTKTRANRLLERKRYDIMFGIRRKDDIC